MALNSLGLGFVFTAKDLASATMRNVEGRFKKLDASSAASAKAVKANLATLGAGVAAAAVGGLALRGAFNLADTAANFGQQLAAVGQITKATDEEMKALKETALDVGLRTKFSPDEIVEGLKNMGAAGLNARQSMEAIEPASLLATSGQIALADASNAVVGTIRSFGFETDQASIVADKLTRSMQLSNTQGQDFAAGLSKASAVMGGFNQSIDTTLVLFGALRNANIDASSSGTALRESVRRLASDQGAQKAIMKQGVDIYDENTGAMRDMGEVMFDLIEKTADLSQEDKNRIAVQVFGARGILAFNAAQKLTTKAMVDGTEVILTQREAYRKLMKETQDAAGTNKEFNAALLDTLAGQKQLLEGAVATLAVALGDPLAQIFKPIVNAIQTAIGGIANFITAIPEPLKKAIAAVGTVLAVVVTLGGAVAALVGAWALLGPILAGAFAALAPFLPVLIGIGAAIGGVVAGFFLLRKAYQENLGDFGARLDDTFGRVKLLFQAIGQLMSGDGKLRGDVLKRLFESGNEGVKDMVIRFAQARLRLQRFFQGIKEGFTLVWNTLGPVFQALGNAVQDLFKELGFGSKGLGVFTSKSEDYRQVGESVGEVIGQIARMIISGLTIAIRVGIVAVQEFKRAWVVLGPVLDVVMNSFVLIFKILGPVLDVVASLVEGIASAEGGISQLTVTTGLLGAGLIYLASGPLVGVLGALLGPVGLVAAAAAAGLAIGSWIDNVTGASDWLADLALDITGVTAELNKLDEAYRNTLKTRQKAEFFDSVADAAKAAGMTTEQFVNMRAEKIAQEQTAQRLGLSQSDIKARLIAGEDVFKELQGPAPEAAQEGVVSQKDGQINAGKIAQKQQADAFEDALNRGEGKRRVTQVNSKLIVDGQTLASATQQAVIEQGALNLEANLANAGEV